MYVCLLEREREVVYGVVVATILGLDCSQLGRFDFSFLYCNNIIGRIWLIHI